MSENHLQLSGSDDPDPKRLKPVGVEGADGDGELPRIPLPDELLIQILSNAALTQQDRDNTWRASRQLRVNTDEADKIWRKLEIKLEETNPALLAHHEHVEAYTRQIREREERPHHLHNPARRERIRREIDQSAITLIELLNDESESWYNDTHMHFLGEARVLEARLLPLLNNHGLNSDTLFQDAVACALMNHRHSLLTAVCTHLTSEPEGDLIDGAIQTLQSNLPDVKLYLHTGRLGTQAIAVGKPTDVTFEKKGDGEWGQPYGLGLGNRYIFINSIKAILMVPVKYSIGDKLQVLRGERLVDAEVESVRPNGSMNVKYIDETSGHKHGQYMLRAAFDDTTLN